MTSRFSCGLWHRSIQGRFQPKQEKQRRAGTDGQNGGIGKSPPQGLSSGEARPRRRSQQKVSGSASGMGGQANAEPAAGLSSPPTHGVRRNYKRTTHATAPCKDCVLGSKGEHRVEEACLPGTMVQQPASRSLRSANARCSASLLGEYDGWPSRAPRAVWNERIFTYHEVVPPHRRRDRDATASVHWRAHRARCRTS